MSRSILLFIGFLIVFFSSVSTSVGQVEKPQASDYKYGQYKKAMAVWQIEQLKSGVLLVRLSTRKASIRALYQAGQDAKAEELEKQVEQTNNSIIQGFKSGFDFCDVYFFESDFSDMVRKNELDKIDFVDKSIKSGAEKNPKDVTCFVAEYANLQADTVKGTDRNKPGYGIDNQTTSTYSNSNLGIPALVIKNDQFVQLTDPFPYYVRSYDSIGVVDRTPVQSVGALNKKLNKFYSNRKQYKPRKKRSVRKAEKNKQS